MMNDEIFLMDFMAGLAKMKDGSVDLVITDPPYEFKDTTGGGIFGTHRGKSLPKHGRTYHAEISPMSFGITDDTLDELCRICKKPNIYLFCNKDQVCQFLNFATARSLNYDILTWHKTNPVPMCSNKYLSDTEYIVFIRGKGVRIYGSYETKRKYFIQEANSKDKNTWKHPTIKPLNIVETFVINSTKEGQTVCDPYMGSGTTAIAALRNNRHYIGFEINEKYYNIARQRICAEQAQLAFQM